MSILLMYDCAISGWTLIHSAVQSPENLNIVKYLLSHEICKPMLLSLGKDSPQQPQPVLPLDLARKQLVSGVELSV